MKGNMYKSSDPVVDYYDISLALCHSEEIEYYKSLSRPINSPCADLCCGTGILSIEIAKQGSKVYSIDNSEAMLSIFRDKLKYESHDIQKSIHINEASMQNFELKEHVKTVICRDAFFHNLTPNEERETLLQINKCLEVDGLFAFNIHNPNPNFLVWAGSDESSNFHDRGTYQIPGSPNKLTIQQALSIDLDSQIITTRLKYLTKAEDGLILKTEESEWKSRYTFPYEMFYLLEICGFKIINVYGNYKREEYNSNTMLVIEALKKH